MIILIDGYNLLKQQNPGAYIEESTREQLVRVLGAYHKRRGHLIMLIFDGGAYSWPTRETKAGIMIIYAGAGKTADDFIKQYIADHHNEDLFLVSSDRELELWASKYDTPSMNALPFYDIIISGHSSDVHKKVRPGEAVKTAASEDPVLDALMLEASEQAVTKQEDRFQEGKRRSGQQESKTDRLLRKKIERL
jgi:predicted RNA-binding protein with PIN domain